MNTWDTTVLSNDITLALWEGEVNSLSPHNWQTKIELSKKMLKNKVCLELQKAGYQSNGELIDLVLNPQIFTYAHDCLTLLLIFRDLSQGNPDSAYANKAKLYEQEFKVQFSEAMQLVELDLNADGNAEQLATAIVRQGRYTR